MTELEQKIFDYIECKYKAKFLGSLSVDITDKSYSLNLITDNYMMPIVITIETTDEDEFYNKIKLQIGERNLIAVKYFKLILNADGTKKRK